jgi:hypothetical protein
MASNTFETSRRLPGIRPPPAYMTTKTGFLLTVCCLASARAAAAAVAAVAVALAAVVIGARSIIVAIEQEDSKLSFDTLGLCNGAAQADGLHCACCSFPDGGSEGEYSSLPAAKVDKMTTHQLISTAVDKDVGGRRRRQGINLGPWQMGGGGGRRGGGSDTTTSQGRQ